MTETQTLGEFQVTIEQLNQVLHRFITKQKPLFIHGAPGIGKSDSVREVVKQIAKEKYMKKNPNIKESDIDINKIYNEGSDNLEKFSLIDVRASQLDPSDIRGIPFPEGNKTKWLIPNWLPKEETEGVLFLDELNLAAPTIQASLYQLILDRRVGDYRLPVGWTIIAAGNRSEDKAQIFPMSAPLKNRFSHVTLSPPSDEQWRDWAYNNGIKSDIIAYLAFKPSMLFKFDSKNKSNAFPTPRTWALASKLTDDIDNTNNNGINEEFVLISSCVGEGAAREYEAFVKLKKLIDINDVLKNPEKAKNITESGIKYTLVSGLAEKYKHDRKKIGSILKVVDYLDNEFAVFLLRLMRGLQENNFVNDLTNEKEWEKLYQRLHKYLF